VEWAKSDVPVRKRAFAWAASLAMGGAMYVVFGVLMTVGPRRERAEVQGKIAGVLTVTLVGPRKMAREQLAIMQAKSRATSSYLWDLHQRDEALRQQIGSRETWAAAIGLVTCAGCFVLCGVSWIKRDDEASPTPQGATPSTV